MRLFNFLSHMPYQNGGNLIFCYSPQAQEFKQPQTAFDLSQGIPQRSMMFQPWQLAVQVGDKVTTLSHDLWITSPMRVFCNPVLEGDRVSFIFARQLYTGRISGDSLADLEIVCEGLFTGFKLGDRGVIGKAPCAGGSQLVLINGTNRQTMNTSLDTILRVIPFGDGLVLTGRKGEDLISVLWQNGEAFRITVDGANIYKCCLSPNKQTVIHAVRAGGFEERYLHKSAATLVAMPDFLRTN